MKWNEWDFRPPLCTCRLNWVRRTFCGWWDEWDDTALQTQISKFEPWRSEAEHATFRSRSLLTIVSFYEWARKKHLVSSKLECQIWARARDLRLPKQAALTNAPGAPSCEHWVFWMKSSICGKSLSGLKTSRIVPCKYKSQYMCKVSRYCLCLCIAV